MYKKNIAKYEWDKKSILKQKTIQNASNKTNTQIFNCVMCKFHPFHSYACRIVILQRIFDQMHTCAQRKCYVVFAPFNNARVAQKILTIIAGHSVNRKKNNNRQI